ncbi:uncharacterized protein LOC128745627 [Sabethes cyaneus]|uniref:uncharacterized protein LOC128745627 n=1 Tax=Sabethes cyaneus TaxID=53552 RepID=UPI00237E21F3|nr:uncharacterized protein LOC128745627 [Sabethes cyaneus]
MSVILETDPCTFDMLMKMKRVLIGWELCKVVEAITAFRCFNCSEYGHKASACSKPHCCPKCAGPHDAKECSADFVKCVNCDQLNKRRNAPDDNLVDICHAAWSIDCPLNMKNLKRARQRIDYST